MVARDAAATSSCRSRSSARPSPTAGASPTDGIRPRPSGPRSLSPHRNPTPRAPAPWAAFPKEQRGERTPPSPTPPAHGADSPARVNTSNSAGFRAGCLPYARRDRTVHMRRPSPGVAIPSEGLTTEEGSNFPMDVENPSAPTCAASPVTADNHPNRAPHSGGLIHDHTRHTTRFTVIGNHLAQHPDLSLLAIGLACHIQSLPPGARVDIKTLAARFPEGATRIAAALRELEAHGYLRRERTRVPGGRIVRAPPRRTRARVPLPRPPAGGHRRPLGPAPHGPAPAPVRHRDRAPRPRCRGLAGAGPHPHRRTPRTDHGPAGGTPDPSGRTPGPPPGGRTPAPSPVPRTRTAPDRPAPSPDLRRLRPRLPRATTGPLPRLPNPPPGVRLA